MPAFAVAVSVENGDKSPLGLTRDYECLKVICPHVAPHRYLSHILSL